MPPSSTYVMIAAVLVAAGLIAVVLRGQWRAAEAEKGKGRARLLAEHVVDMVSTHDATGVFRYASPVFAGLVGEYPGLLVGKDPNDLAHEADRAALAGLWRRALNGRGAGVSLIWRCRRHNGDYAWLETTARAASAEAAAMGAIICASRDVTERKQIEDALRESEQRFRGALETVRLVAMGLDASGVITFANDALCGLTAWQRAELIGENWFDKLGVAGDGSRERFYEWMSKGDVAATTETEIVCRDGTRRTIAWDHTILRSPSGEVQGTASLGADVTERRHDEATMKLLQNITHSISAAKDLDAALKQTLESLCVATGWNYGEAWLPNDDVPPRLKLYTIYAAPGVNAGLLAADGATRSFAPGEGLPGQAWKSRNIEWFRSLKSVSAELSPRVIVAAKCGFQSAIAVPIPSAHGIVAVLAFFMQRPPASDDRQTHMVAVIADQVGALIDRRREQKEYEANLTAARERAEAANQAKSDFLSRMSHELRTPLNSVIGFANVMKKNRSGKLTQDELEYLERITQNGKHLLSLVNDVLDIAKVEAGRMTVSMGLVNVDELLRDVVAQLSGQPRNPGVELRAEAPDDVVPIEADGALLRQVLINLTGNAIRFTHKGSIVLSADVKDGMPTHLHVKDTGIGVPEDRLKAIFEPFEQAEDQTHLTYGGTGLGLSISRSICDALGYSLTVESKVGEGSTFTIELATDNH